MGSILEMIIVLAAAAVLTMQGIKEDVANKRTALLQVEGQNQAAINAGLADYLTNNIGTLIPAGFSQTSSTALPAPTLATISAQSNTKVNYKTGPFWGGTYQIQLSVVPANCSAAAGTCHIVSLFYPSQPLKKGGVADVGGAGIVAAAAGNQFGYSTNRVPGTISGLNGQWNTPNPVGNVAATIVGINGFGNDANSPYYRRDRALPLTQALAGGGQDLDNVRTVNAQSAVFPGGATGSVDVGTAQFYGDSNNAAVRTNGALFVQNAAGSAAANVNMAALSATTATLSTNGGALTIGSAGVNFYGDQNSSAAIRGNNGLYVQTLAGAAAPIQQVSNINASGTVTAPIVNINTSAANCSWNTITMRGANQMWVCNKYGNWVPLSNLVGNFTTDAQLQGYANGYQIAVPACGPGGSAWWKVIPSSMSTNYATANPPLAGVLYGMGYNGTNWVLNIFDIMANGSNTAVQDQLGLQAEVDTGCSFGNE